jgi:hypothetical protein
MDQDVAAHHCVELSRRIKAINFRLFKSTFLMPLPGRSALPEDCLGSLIDSYDPARGSNEFGRKKGQVAPRTSEVEHAHTWCYAGFAK